MDSVFTLSNLIGLVTLIALEVVLGIDNIIFMAIQTDRLPPQQREVARKIGLIVAGGLRIALLFSISIIVGLKSELVTILGHPITGKDLVFIGGGIYLLWHSVREIHHKVGGRDDEHHVVRAAATFGRVLLSVLILDLVFSIDSVITAVGMIDSVLVMSIAIIFSVLVMFFFSGAVIRFIQRHQSVQILALSFLVLIAVLLVAEGFGQHVSKGYVYAAVVFSTIVELLQIRADQKQKKHAT